MTKRIAVIGALLVLFSAVSVWAYQPQPVQGSSEGLLDVLLDAAFAPCQVLTACIGAEGSHLAAAPCPVYCSRPVCTTFTPCTPAKVPPLARLINPCVEVPLQCIHRVTTTTVRYVAIPEQLTRTPSKHREIRQVSAPPSEPAHLPRVPDIQPAVPKPPPPDRIGKPREPLPEMSEPAAPRLEPSAPRTTLPDKPPRYNEVTTVPTVPAARPPHTEIQRQTQTTPVVPPKMAGPEPTPPALPSAPAPVAPVLERKTEPPAIKTEQKRPETKTPEMKPEPKPEPEVKQPSVEKKPPAPKVEIQVQEKRPKKKPAASPPCGSCYPMPRCY